MWLSVGIGCRAVGSLPEPGGREVTRLVGHPSRLPPGRLPTGRGLEDPLLVEGRSGIGPDETCKEKDRGG